jgi:hypothetical protein
MSSDRLARPARGDGASAVDVPSGPRRPLCPLLLPLPPGLPLLPLLPLLLLLLLLLLRLLLLEEADGLECRGFLPPPELPLVSAAA